MVVVKLAGGMAGEFQDGRAAHAPMGDEQGPGGAESGAGDEGGGIVNDGAHQRLKVFIGYGKGEKRRHSLDNRYPCHRGGASASGNGNEVVVGEFAERRDLTFGADADAMTARFGEKEVDDGV